MNITLRPGFVYILYSPNRPKDVKVGRALSVAEREKALSLADPDLKLHACLPFVDAVATEFALHGLFEAQRIDRETFRVRRADAFRQLQRLHDFEARQRAYLRTVFRFMVDTAMLGSEADEVLASSGSALSALLAHVPSERDGRNVKMLTTVALSSTPAASVATRLLRKCGLLPYATDGVVLFDRSAGSALAKVLGRKHCKTTWRQQLARYAGLDENARTISLGSWLDRTEASSELVDLVNPVCEPTR
jgi:hypothetical protein